MQCKYHEEILKGIKVQNMFQKEYLIRIMSTGEEQIRKK